MLPVFHDCSKNEIHAILWTTYWTVQISGHEMIAIYTAHTITYKVDPLYTGDEDNGIPFEHLAPCCGLVSLYDKVIFHYTGVQKECHSGLWQT